MTPERFAAARRSLAELGLGLAQAYPWAFRLAEPVRAAHPEWWQAFCAAEPQAAELPMAQARDWAFIDFLDRSLEPDEWQPFDIAVAAYLSSAPAALSRELDNTVEWYRQLAQR